MGKVVGVACHPELMVAELIELSVLDAAAWRDWLARQHAASPGVWLVLAKKGTVEPTSLTYDQALDEALCHGWIDGQVRRRDDATFQQRFTPRTKRSPWSRRNVGLVMGLIEAGRMTSAGLAQVEQARADGRWEVAYAGPATIEVPSDLAQALAAAPRAQQMFDILTSQNRYAVLLRIGAAKRPQTRRDRIARFVQMLAQGETVYPQRRTLAD
jgi:uncharacterized protein YdeI (YjbR/CyaY-like superfamily)